MTEQGRGIGEAAQVAGVSEDTLRYYEREGLVGPVPRDSLGRRRYGDDDLAWISIVTCLRTAGLGIADLRRFTELLRSAAEPTERTEFLQRRQRELIERRDALDAAITVLGEKIEHYRR